MARRSKKIDFVHWSGFGAVATALSAGSLGATVGVGQHLPETIMRTRGTLLAWIDGAQSSGVGVNVGVGLHVVPAGTGATVLTAPLTDPDADWFYYTTFALAYEEYVSDVVYAPDAVSYREVIDSKAMRRSQQSTEVQLVFENATISGLSGTAINAFVDGRILTGT